MGFPKHYNVSGTVHCDDRLDELCDVVRCVLQTEEIGMIGHYTGATTVGGKTEVAAFMTTGFDLHSFVALVPGERSNWLAFAEALESELSFANFPYSICVHEAVVHRDSV